jgi:hypothetical protein
VRIAAVIPTALLAAASAAAQPSYTLYDQTAGTLPATQPWLVYADNAFLTGGSVSRRTSPDRGRG